MVLNITVEIKVILINNTDKSRDEVIVKDAKSKDSFTYYDNYNCLCKMKIFAEGIILIRQAKDHMLELNLCKKPYAKISSEEGIIQFDTKVVDFKQNNDILVMHYLIDEEDRIIEINFN